MLEGGAERTHSERITERVRMNGDVADERVFRALLEHLLELIDEHVAELARAVLAMDDLR